MHRHAASVAVCLLGVASVGSAQDLSILDGRIENVVTCELGVNCDDRLADLLDNVYRVLLVEDTAQDLAFRRADVQVGASSGSSGSTSSVLNPVIPAAFGFALETGSITRSISGTTTTVQINPAGLLCAAGPEADAVRLRDRRCNPESRRVGIALSFDMSRGDATEEIEGVTALGDQLSEASVRVELINRRQPASRWFRNKVDEWAESARDFAGSSVRINVAIEPFIQAAGQDLVTRVTVAKEADAAPETLDAELRNALSQVLANIRTAAASGEITLPQHLLQSASQSRIDQARRNLAVFNELAHAWVVTAEYAFQRPSVVTEAIEDVVPAGTRPPSLHTARLIAAKGFTDLNLDVTLNVSSSWFKTEPTTNTGRWRDVQVGVEGKFLLREIPEFGYPVLSFAGLWMRLRQEPLGLGIQAFNEAEIGGPGNLGVFQFKLEVPTANAAVRVPISFTYASRTELIRERDVRGQVGISLNMDALFAGSD